MRASLDRPDASRVPVLGIWVGGRGTRMGGVQKALLRAPGASETLLERSLRLARELDLEPVLIGRADLGEIAEGLLQLPDDPSGIGPLGGLSSLFAYARERPALTLACDMPYVSAALLARLAREAPQAQLLAPRDAASGKWQTLFARHDGPSVSQPLRETLAAGERSFQSLFKRVAVSELALSPDERAQLRDWDTPEDMRS